MTQRVCRRTGCNKKISEDGIRTELGWFCSKECLSEIQKRIMRFLYPSPTLHKVFDEIDKLTPSKENK
jgi:hypothetical protein